jgi:signal transduction histidine kinase
MIKQFFNCFLLFLIVFICTLNTQHVFGFQQSSAADSLRLEKYLSVLNGISPDLVDRIIEVSDKAILEFKIEKNPYNVCKINQATGSLFIKFGYLSLSEKYLTDALNYAIELKNKELEVDITNTIGVLWGKKGDYLKSESYFLTALLKAQKANYTQGKVSSYFKIGVLRIKEDKPDEALKFYLKVDSINSKNGTSFLKTDLINNKAIVYAIKGDLDNALKQFELSYKLALKDKRIVDQVLAYQNIGLVYKERNDYKNAIKYLDAGIALAQKSGLHEEELRISIAKPSILIEQKNYSLAKQQFLQILEKSKKIELNDLSIEIYSSLVYILQEQQDYKSALVYFKEGTALKNLQTNKLKQRALAEANVSLGLYTANQKILESESLLFQKTREKNILLIVLLFGALLTVGLIVVSLRLKKLNDKLNIKKADLTESNHVKNKLFSIIGHDLRGSQGTTLGILGLIEEGELDPIEQKKYIEIVIKQTTSSLAILDDLLLWGQAHVKGEKLEKKPLLVLPFVQKAIDLNLDIITEKSISISPIALENLNIIMETNHFAFVIRNLIANAIKFTPHQGAVEIYAEDYSGRLIKICVSDNGIGIPNGDLESIFLPESLSRKGTNNEKGTGLGLTLCKEFVKANGGEIWAEQNDKKGTRLCFTVEKAD